MAKQTPSEIHDHNLKRIYQLTYQTGRISRIALSEQLELSLPTVSQALKQLEEARLIERNGLFQSTGGRKSIVYTCVTNARVAVGVQISEHHLRLAAIDLYGKVIKRTAHRCSYAHRPEYYQTFGRLVNEFCQSLNLSPTASWGLESPSRACSPPTT